MATLTTPYGAINVANSSSSIFEFTDTKTSIDLYFNNLSTPTNADLFASNMWIKAAQNAPNECIVKFPPIGVDGAGQNAIIWVESSKRILFKDSNDVTIFDHPGTTPNKGYFIAAFLPGEWKWQTLGAFITNINTTALAGKGLQASGTRLDVVEPVSFTNSLATTVSVTQSWWGQRVIARGDFLTQINFNADLPNGFYSSLYNNTPRILILHPSTGYLINDKTEDLFLGPFSFCTINKGGTNSYWISSSSFTTFVNGFISLIWSDQDSIVLNNLQRRYSTFRCLPAANSNILNFGNNYGTYSVTNFSASFSLNLVGALAPAVTLAPEEAAVVIHTTTKINLIK